MLDKSAKIYVAGHHGLVGSAIWNNLLQRGYTNLVGRSHKELDLLDGACSTVPTSSGRISRSSRTSSGRASATG